MVVQDRQELRRKLLARAAAQAGYFTAAQALEAGYSYPAQRYHVHRNNWAQIDRGLFRVPEWPSSEHEHLVRWTLWSHGKAIVSHDSAVSLHDLGDLNPEQVHLTVPPGFRAKAPGVALHRGTLAAADIQERGGFRVTTPLRSIVDVATGSIEADRLVQVVADALDGGMVTPRQLRASAEAVDPRAALRIERALGALKR